MKWAACLLLFCTICRAQTTPLSYLPQTGDLLFQSLPHNEVIDAIEGASASPYSHCGVVVKTDNEWKVLEAVGPVKETPLAQWISQGREGKFAVQRLKPKFRIHIPQMIEGARLYLGRPYDIQYELDDEKIYCSELIYKGWLHATRKPLGKLVKLGELNWQPHETIIRRIAGGLPLDRPMITPRDLAAAPELDPILTFGLHSVVRPQKKR
jgi:Permuted papain-like amidase enzyme, YaeF/YiiX, C92 family